MGSIEANRAIEIPGSLLMMRRADKRDCYQCPITKEPTGVPVSTSEQVSLRDEGPRCQAGACHAQERDGRGGADVRGRVRAGIAARHEEVVSCVECDFDVCDACGGR
jgi:hypothetical protein